MDESFDNIFEGIFNNPKTQSNKCIKCSNIKIKINNIREQMKRNIEFARKTSDNEEEYLKKLKNYYQDVYKMLGVILKI